MVDVTHTTNSCMAYNPYCSGMNKFKTINMYEVYVEYGPHMSNTLVVVANSGEEAIKYGESYAKERRYTSYMITYKLMKESE